MRTWIAFALVLFGAGCGSAVTAADDATGSSSGPGSSSGTTATATATATTETQTSGGSSSSTTEAGTTSTSSDGTSSTGPAGDSTSTGASACAMDILFVVDNSGSMGTRIDRLRAAVPEFVGALDGVDLRAMVVDVDGDPFELCATACVDTPECFDEGACPGISACLIPCAVCEGYDCDNTTAFEGCGGTLGAGLDVEQGEPDFPSCDFASGERWIDGTEPSFAAALGCAVNVGIDSTAPTELVMQSMVAAVDTEGDAAACNEGFLRPDAGLAVVIVTDEDDDIEDSEGNPMFWQLELETSQQDEERIVVLAITGDNGQAGSLCTDEGGPEPAKVAPRIQAFVERFGERGLFGSVCAPDFAPPLLEAATAIVATCE